MPTYDLNDTESKLVYDLENHCGFTESAQKEIPNLDVNDILSKVKGLLGQLEDGSGKEVMKFHANVKMELFGPDGALKEERVIHNVIANAGKNLVLQSDGTSKYPKQFSYIAIGTGTTAAANTDTALQTELVRAAATVSTPSSGTLRFVYTFPAGTGTGAITESGLLDASSTGNMLARQVFSAVNKGAADSLQITWDIT